MARRSLVEPSHRRSAGRLQLVSSAGRSRSNNRTASRFRGEVEMHHPLNIVHQISRIPHRLYWEIVVHIPTILFVAWLYLVNRYRCTPITGNTGPVVSLTTYGKRIGTVFLAIESIGRGRVLPSRLILWVDESSILDKVPMTIWRLKQRGL